MNVKQNKINEKPKNNEKAKKHKKLNDTQETNKNVPNKNDDLCSKTKSNRNLIVELISQIESIDIDPKSKAGKETRKKFVKHPFFEKVQPKVVAESVEDFIEENMMKPDHNILFQINYGYDFDESLARDEIDNSNVLKNTEISAKLRAKMIDWMIEVFANYPKTSSLKTFFTAVHILDSFFKRSTKKLKDSDVHLSGVASIFIASKYEDIYHITLSEIVERVGHSKFKAEFEILSTLNFKIFFPTLLKFLQNHLFKYFYNENIEILTNIKEMSMYLLKMCLYDTEIMNFAPKILSFSCLVFSIKTIFFELREGAIEKEKNELKIQEESILNNIFLYTTSDIQIIEKCLYKIQELVNRFDKAYSDISNLHRYHLEIIN